jgi:hypothetical protein
MPSSGKTSQPASAVGGRSFDTFAVRAYTIFATSQHSISHPALAIGAGVALQAVYVSKMEHNITRVWHGKQSPPPPTPPAQRG